MSKRWWIAAMLATATAINYLDRQNLPVAISDVIRQLERTMHRQPGIVIGEERNGPAA
jgi:hypothetical protein